MDMRAANIFFPAPTYPVRLLAPRRDLCRGTLTVQQRDRTDRAQLLIQMYLHKDRVSDPDPH